MIRPAAPAPACPLCGKPASPDYRPFCSKRCADVDLQRWLTGAYVVPGKADDEASAGPPPVDDDG